MIISLQNTMDNTAAVAPATRAGLQSHPNAAQILLTIATELEHELRTGRAFRTGLAASLERDWGFDSLSRAELLLRVERAFSVHLPERLLGEANTLQDIFMALKNATAASGAFDTTIQPLAVAETAESAPFDAATLIEALDWHVSYHGDRVHIVLWRGDGQETSLTYRELAEHARAVARGFLQAGLQPGERVAIMLPTSEAFFAAFFGILYAGGVPVPIYPPARPSQIEEHLTRQAGILKNAGAVLLVATAEAASIARLLRLQVETVRAVVSIEELSQEAGSLPITSDSQTLALLQYTSGSTGDPKGVILSHANLLANIRAMGTAMNASSSDIFVSWLPLYHDMGLIGAWLGCLYFAAPLVVMSPLTFLVRPEQWIRAIHRHRATLSAAPNFAFELCLRNITDASIDGLDLRSLRLIANGSEPVSAETIWRFTARFAKWGFRSEAMAPVYGLAENAVGLAFPPPGRVPVIDRIDREALAARGEAIPAGPEDPNALEIVGCGRPLPEHQIRIVDANGEAGERREGNLQFRGPSASQGYFGNPEKTHELFDGDWLNSGDIAYVAGGEVFITGRSKDIIIRAGRHIYPEEVEAAVGNIHGIRKGCVVALGIVDQTTGTERIVVLAETRETNPVILSKLREEAENTAARLLDSPPDEVILVPPHAIPKTSSGKLRRRAARELYEKRRLSVRPRPLWQQLVRLAISGIGPQLRRATRTTAELVYAGWWWSVVVVLGTLLWPTIILLPRPAWRWTIMHRAARMALRLMGVGLHIDGRATNLHGNIIVSSHASYIDGLIVSAVLPGVLAFVVKKELEIQFFAGPFLRALGVLFVDRSDPEGGVGDAKRAAGAAAAGSLLVFFPEGTFTRAPGLLPFKLGAFVIAAQQSLGVVPLALRGNRSVLRGEQWFPRRGNVSVHIGKPIVPDGRDFAAAIRLRDEVRTVILAHCGEPNVETT